MGILKSLLIMILSLTAFAGEPLPGTIAQIRVKGQSEVLHSEIRDLLDLKVGDLYDAAKLEVGLLRATERFFYLGYWRAELSSKSSVQPVSETVDLEIQLQVGPKYQLQIVGEMFRDVGDIRTRILEKMRKSGLNDRVLDQLVYQIRSMYRKVGFQNAQVELTVSDDVLTCQIQEGRRLLVDDVQLEGNHFFTSDALLDVVDRVAPNEDYWAFDAAYWSELKQRWLQMYAREGFLDTKISGPNISYSTNGYFAHLRYRVVEGPQTLIGDVNVSQGSLPAEALAQVGVAPGKPLNSLAIESGRNALEQQLWNNGYPFATVKSEIGSSSLIDHVEVNYQVMTGDGVTIQSITFNGNEVTRDSLLQRRLKIHVGDRFSLEKIAATRNSLMQTDLFDKVDIFLDPIAQGTARPLFIELVEGKRTRVEVGLGASLEDGPRVTGILQRRNLLGLGISFRTRLQLNYPAVFYHVPLFYPAKVITELENRFRDVNSSIRPLLYTEGRLSAGLEYPKMPIAPFDVNGSLDVNAAREIKPAYNLNRVALELALSFSPMQSLQLSPQMELESALFQGRLQAVQFRRIDAGQVNQWTLRLFSALDRRDNPIDPRSGFSLELNSDLGIGQAALVDGMLPVRYVRLLGALNWCVPLSQKVIWSATARYGQILNVATNAYVPLFKRFYFGGTSTVRGFPEDQILPADDPQISGISQGGNSLTLLRNEIRFPIKGALGGAVFVDVGELLEDISKWSLYGLAVGAGIGIRYLTPIGPLMFDLGYRVWDGDRISRNNFWNTIGIHFSVGYP